MKTEQMQDALHLYLQTNLTKTEIAHYLNISRRSVNSWARDMEWERIKNCAGHIPMIMAGNNYLVMAKLQNEILSDQCADQPLDLRKINTLCKVANTTRKLTTRNTLNDNIELRELFLSHVNAQNPELALTIQPYIDSYLISQVKAGSREFKDLKTAWEAIQPVTQSNVAPSTDTPEPKPLTRRQLIELEEARLDQEDLEYWAQNPTSKDDPEYYPEWTNANEPKTSSTNSDLLNPDSNPSTANKKVAWANPDQEMKARMEQLKNQGLSRAQRRKIIRTKVAA